MLVPLPKHKSRLAQPDASPQAPPCPGALNASREPPETWASLVGEPPETSASLVGEPPETWASLVGEPPETSGSPIGVLMCCIKTDWLTCRMFIKIFPAHYGVLMWCVKFNIFKRIVSGERAVSRLSSNHRLGHQARQMKSGAAVILCESWASRVVTRGHSFSSRCWWIKQRPFESLGTPGPHRHIATKPEGTHAAHCWSPVCSKGE